MNVHAWFFAAILPLRLWAAPSSAAAPVGVAVPVSPAGLATAPLTFPDGKTITVDLADTPHLRERGLMDRGKLPRDYGMLFVFASESRLQFWMKNTYVDLDMVFIGKDKLITEVHGHVPRSFATTPESKLARRGGVAQYVLELPAGAAARHKLGKGRKLVFDVTIPLI